LCLCFSNLFLNITSCTSNLDAHLLRRFKDNLPCQLWLVWNGLIWAMVSMESCSWSCSPDIPLIWVVMGQHWNQSFGPTIETECQGDACTFHRRKIAIVGARKPRVWTWCQVRCFHDVDPTIYSHSTILCQFYRCGCCTFSKQTGSYETENSRSRWQIWKCSLRFDSFRWVCRVDEMQLYTAKKALQRPGLWMFYLTRNDLNTVPRSPQTQHFGWFALWQLGQVMRPSTGE
jgi:hypothetical protein